MNRYNFSDRTYRYNLRNNNREINYFIKLFQNEKNECDTLRDEIKKWKISYEILKNFYNDLYISNRTSEELCTELKNENERLKNENKTSELI
jgi:hypothetical protein